MIPIWGSGACYPYFPNCKSRRSVYATVMCTMLVLFYLHQQKENYQMMGAFTRKSLDMGCHFLASFEYQFLNALFSQFLSIFLSELVCIKESKHFTPTQFTDYRKKSITTDAVMHFMTIPNWGSWPKTISKTAKLTHINVFFFIHFSD